MPLKDPTLYASYMKSYMKKRRTKASVVNPMEKWKNDISKLNQQFISRAAFPRHIYEFRLTLEAIHSALM